MSDLTPAQAEIRRVLENAHHELTTLHGLRATDGDVPDELVERFTVIDTRDRLQEIDDVLNGVFAVWEEERIAHASRRQDSNLHQEGA